MALIKLTKEEKTENQAGEAHCDRLTIRSFNMENVLVIYPEEMTRSTFQKVLMYWNVTRKTTPKAMRTLERRD